MGYLAALLSVLSEEHYLPVSAIRWRIGLIHGIKNRSGQCIARDMRDCEQEGVAARHETRSRLLWRRTSYGTLMLEAAAREGPVGVPYQNNQVRFAKNGEPHDFENKAATTSSSKR